MYGGGGGSSDGESTAQRKIPAASSMLWVRNLRRFIGSGAGLGSEALMELETKRILLDIFKEKQQKSAEAASIPSFFKKVYTISLETGRRIYQPKSPEACKISVFKEAI